MTSSPIKIIIFDFDGTLADTFDFLVKAFNQIAHQYNLPQIPNSEIKNLKNLSARELFQKYPLSPWKLLKFSRHIRSELKQNIKEITPFPGIHKLLKNLKKSDIEIGIVTSNSKQNVELFLKNHNIDEIDFVYSEKNLFGKGRVLSSLIRKNKLNKNEVIYVGDEVRDIEAGKKADIKIVSVTWGLNSKSRLQRSSPDYLVNKPEDILKIL
jgi:HAD superfamily hydrolase (TIGR01549 family)